MAIITSGIVIIQVYAESGAYLHPREGVATLARVMPRIVIDWHPGNQIIDEQKRAILQYDAAPVILEEHQLLVDNTVWVELSFPQFGSNSVCFVVQPHRAFSMRCLGDDNQELLLHAAGKVATYL